MRRGLKWAAGIVAVLIGLPLLALALLVVAANTNPGRALIERLTPQLTGGMVHLAGIAGRFPDAPRVARIEVDDARGAWLTIDGAALDWRPLRLLAGAADIDRLAATRVAVARLPSYGRAASSGGSFTLPVRVDLRALHVDRLDLAAPVAGTPASLGVDGAARLAALDDGTADLDLHRLDGDGRYTLHGRITPATLAAAVSAHEPAHGLLAGLAGLPDLGAIALAATIDGPRDALATKLALTAGPLRADAHGTVDLVHRAADLAVAADAPAMTPRPGLSWQAAALNAHVQGPFTRPSARGTLRIDALTAAGATVHQIAAGLAGDAGQATVHLTADGIVLPGPQPDLLGAAPLVLDATAQLDAPARPIRFTLRHPLLTLDGTARTAGALAADATLTLPDLAPFAAVGGIDLHGSTTLALHGATAGADTTLAADGTLGITGGIAPLPALVGDAAHIAVAATLRGNDIALHRLALDGRTLALHASGTDAAGTLSLDWNTSLTDLSVLAPQLTGKLAASGHVGGPPNALALAADLTGEVAASGMTSGPLTAHLDATGLPGAPAGTLTAQGALLGAPLELALAAERAADGTLHLSVSRAAWKSAHADGALTLPPGATLPQGSIAFAMTRLADLSPLLGRPLAGSITGKLDSDARQARLQLDARDAGLPGSASAGRATLAATIAEPQAHPVVTARLVLDGIAASGIAGSAQLQADGPLDALALRLTAALPDLAGAPAQIATSATLDTPAKRVALNTLQTTWRGETLRLLAPARIGYGDGITVDRARLGLRQATLDVSGRIDPTLDLSANLRNLPADLAAVVAPGYAADGTLNATARLTGSTARPAGTITVTAAGLRLRQGPGRALPAATLDARAVLDGAAARIDARLAAGASRLAVNGSAPLSAAGPLDLRATGNVDLAMLDPLLAAQGRRVRGRVALDAAVAGTARVPRIGGTAQLSGGEVQDIAQGIHLTNLTALLQAEGDTIRLVRLDAAAGAGTIAARGTVGAFAPGIPIDLTLTARNARPLASDLLTAQLNADLTLRGQLQGQLAAAGTVFIQRAEIHVPEKLPPSIAVLDVRVPGQKTPPPPAPPPDVALNLTLRAPEQIFVRGRGLDAELGGTVHVGGTLAHPLPDGGFHLRRGTFSLAGTTLTFGQGEISFNGAGLTDPSLDLQATTSNATTTATLTVGGTARAPKITLSSVPELPQDEILAQLLFNRSANQLGPFQLAEIAAALASFSGVAPGAADPLAGVRGTLGLDRLSVGSDSNGNATVEAGRYVARNVYVGARQAASGTGSQAVVQVDIAKGLKLQGTVGNGTSSATGSNTESNATSIGLQYQFEY